MVPGMLYIRPGAIMHTMVAASKKQVGRVETVMDEKDAVKNPKPEAKWSERLGALRRVPPVMKMVWSCAPEVVVGSIGARLIVSVVPVALLLVTRQVIDTIDRHLWYHWALPHYFWWLVALEFVLASIAAMLGRLLNYFDTILADKFTRHISTRIMEHASRLDLTRYEDPLFYDKMERARVQGTDRVMMIQMMGRFMQDLIGAVSLAV